VWDPQEEVDLGRTLGPARRGAGDPTFRVAADGAFWRGVRTPAGPGALRLAMGARTGGKVHARAYGPGGEWLLDAVPGMLGAHDDVASFVPAHPLIARAAMAVPGFRVGRLGSVFDMLVPAVLEQKVVGREAWRAWRYLVRRFGEVAPGPAPDGPLYVPPAPADWVRVPSWEWHRAGAEAVRARTIIGAARVAERLEGHDSAETDRRLRSLPGIGVWTSAEVRQRALGDADAVSVGDYHLPSIVGWSLTGEKTDDAGMLDLLRPYAGHRYRVTRLLELTGSRLPPRGPRMPVRDYRHI
jgi:3-methyladenine DNA glycosylase/8-oxoguanine DNA glycosylase